MKQKLADAEQRALIAEEQLKVCFFRLLLT
jgi:hypothetical protein